MSASLSAAGVLAGVGEEVVEVEVVSGVIWVQFAMESWLLVSPIGATTTIQLPF